MTSKATVLANLMSENAALGRRAAELEKQRDELLAALGKILYCGDAASSSVAREAIYAVRGAA